MGYEMSLAKSLKRMEASKLGLALLVGFCIGVSTCFISMTASTAEQQLSLAYANPVAESNNYSQISDDAGGGHGAEGSSPSTNAVNRMKQTSSSSSTKYNVPLGGEVKDGSPEFEHEKKTVAKHGEVAEEKIQLKMPLNQNKAKIESKQPGTLKANSESLRPVCDLSNPRTDVCEMAGDVRIDGKSSSVVLVTDHQPHSSESSKQSWRIKPYARKFDPAAMAHIRELSVKVSSGLGGDVPRCTINHSVPAVVFALGGYTGNYYHDFTDVLVPLFITSRQFDGEVQFVVETKNSWWISKYELILKKLSRYDIIYFSSDDHRVHCYRRVIVGLHSHKTMSIDPARAPNGYSMADFTKLMRAAYSLPRDSPIRLGGHRLAKKPRLLIIPRHGTRKFTNLEEIVRLAAELEFEVVAAEAKMGSDVADVARTVNNCDVMVGVHGAGLTNFVFLPANAVIIQVVPYGDLESISRSCFGYPSEDARLHYLEYSIGVEESTLTELYPREHAVFRDPKSVHRQGWNKMGEVYLDKQNVKLDVNRFKPHLLKARQLLHQ